MAAVFDSSVTMQLRLCSNLANSECLPGRVLDRSHDAVMRVYDEPANVIETHDYAGGFKEW
jgi:hypothetical protein